jgi:hypothetical protein
MAGSPSSRCKPGGARIASTNFEMEAPRPANLPLLRQGLSELMIAAEELRVADEAERMPSAAPRVWLSQFPVREVMWW